MNYMFKLTKEEREQNKRSHSLVVQSTYKYAREALDKITRVGEWSEKFCGGLRNRRAEVLSAIPQIKDNPFGMRARIYSASTFHDMKGNLVY